MREGMGLYRGKRIDNGEWVEGSLIKCGITQKCFIHNKSDCVNESQQVGYEGCLYLVTYEVDPETVGQCTELKCKNGNMIFEGDIVTSFSGSKDKISFINGCFQLASIANPTRNLSLLDGLSSFLEVIGNIYDNPELMG